MAIKQYGGVIYLGESRGSGDGCSLNTKEGDEHRVLRTVVLIWSVPENPACLQATHRAAYIFSVVDMTVVANAAVEHRRLKQRILVRSIGHVHIPNEIEQEGTNFQTREMRTEKHHALTFRESRLQIFQSSHSGARSIVFWISKPGDSDLDKPYAVRQEGLSHQFLVFLLG